MGVEEALAMLSSTTATEDRGMFLLETQQQGQQGVWQTNEVAPAHETNKVSFTAGHGSGLQIDTVSSLRFFVRAVWADSCKCRHNPAGPKI